ncbi:hypothetical protein PENARI_c075G08836 [Penicillium arizonense]|jgi:nucleoside-diphosphate-sugar epimerase|uniref:NAD-dependent epimerase/dehydratase domain-containing protein n=1 Tax=Penicillium arizonense TaxID=1835702 RepID=A0A1F5L1U9_PENAI|nr:hypothetical protein PENARI_c075G08836 [Penicillium arizonense]OGE47017.1 hypothetical protein PENARI_c075G08836 [Penicillium arizonense]
MLDQLILVTGASGFVATHIIDVFLRSGFLIRGTVRSYDKAEKVSQAFPEYVRDGRLTFTIVRDISSFNAFDEAVKDVTGIIHTATPFQMQVENNERDLLIPAIEGTKNILRSINENVPNLRRLVLISSFASIIDLSKGNRPDYVYSEKDWNPMSYQEAAKKGTSGAEAYCAAKALAEREAWDFVKRECPSWDLTTICPPMVYGPNKNATTDLAHLNTSSADIYRLMSPTSKPSDPMPANDFWAWVDVRDVADAHLKAYELPEAGGQRFFVAEGNFSYQMIADILRERLPEVRERVPIGMPQSGLGNVEVYGVDNSKSKQLLGIKYRTLQNSVLDAAQSLLELERREQT